MPFAVTIQKLIPGGKGFALHEGRAVFVPLSAPGDHILVKTFRDRNSYLEALETEMLQPSTYRNVPPCPYFGTCGGCDLQQIDENNQMPAKREILVDALARTGKIQYLASRIKMIPSPFWHYRNRIQLKVRWEGDRLVWGFYRSGSHEITSLDSCLITLAPLWRFSNQLMKWLNSRHSLLKCCSSIEILQGDNEEFLVEFQLDSHQPSGEYLARAIRELDFVGFRQASLSLSSGAGGSLLATGPGFVSKRVGDLVYQVGQGSFFQVNELLLSTLRDCALANAKGGTALDLYSGVGFFSLALAKHFERVMAVEVSSSGGRDLRRNLAINRLLNCQPISRDAGAFIREHCGKLGNIDFILLDPPRVGLRPEAVADVANLGAPSVVYVSCDPTTLSRDLSVFLKHQYEISSIDMLDLFPQTHHFETIAKLRKSYS